MNSILFIAPLPPPIDGQSKASHKVLDSFLGSGYKVTIINTNRASINRNLIIQIQRTFIVLNILYKIIIRRNSSDIIYISISESILGNIKDIIIYLILYKNLNKVYIHMLGGAGMNKILNANLILSGVNGFFMRKMKGIFVEGKIGRQIFSKYFSKNNIFIVNNSVDDYLFASDIAIHNKFKSTDKIGILFLSNLIKEKGYFDLFYAFCLLPESIKYKFNLSFVGGFPSALDKEKFFKAISTEPNVKYIGDFIDGVDKYNLFMKNHIFCLPTYYPYEGQPISILEAYASGCAVITTMHGGISDIFVDGVNGYSVLPGDHDSISKALQKVVYNFDNIYKFALNNSFEAKCKYKDSAFSNKFIEIMKDFNCQKKI